MATRKNKSKLRIRLWQAKDIPAIVECHRAAYPEYPESAYYTVRYYEMQFAAFPEGQYLAEVDGLVAGYATALIVQLDDESHWYTYEEITGGGTFSTHDPSGDTLYGADIAVRPEYRRHGISRQLYEKRIGIMKRYNLRRMIAYGRIPGYTKIAGKMTAEEYVQKVITGEMTDPSLSAHLRAGYTVRRVLLDFLWDESQLLNAAGNGQYGLSAGKTTHCRGAAATGGAPRARLRGPVVHAPHPLVGRVRAHGHLLCRDGRHLSFPLPVDARTLYSAAFLADARRPRLARGDSPAGQHDRTLYRPALGVGAKTWRLHHWRLAAGDSRRRPLQRGPSLHACGQLLHPGRAAHSPHRTDRF
jgi:ribosomal protein S18 acetylase RimI-like enzyme